MAALTNSRNEAIAEIKRALRVRSGKAWSVTGGRGTAWGWLRIDAPPAITGDLRTERHAELAALLALDSVHHQGCSVPASSAHYREYIDRANGRPATVAEAYWD